MDFIPPAYTQKIGDPKCPRFIFRDNVGRYFTGTEWSENPSEAALYYTETDAIAAQNRYSDGKQVNDTFLATIIVTVDKNEWTREALAAYLRYRVILSLRESTDKRDLAVEVIWDELKKVE
jgi:hypothetical protein